MTLILSLLSPRVMQALGWALVHFVWQGVLIAGVLACSLRLLRDRSATIRYLLCCGALWMMLCLPIITGGLVYEATVPRPLDTGNQNPLTEVETTPGAPLLPNLTATPVEDLFSIPRDERFAVRFDWLMPWMVSAWLIGVAFLSIRQAGGWVYLQRLTRRAGLPVAQPWQQSLHRLMQEMGIARPVRLLESARVQVPIVIGWLRPAVLIPMSILTGLTPQQVDAILAHELAHIRRHDYLVNLLQTLVETLLFYHPAVWWVSGRVRQEREYCCDDLAVAVCGDRVAYARALTDLESLRTADHALAPAATGGSLLDRIRRVIEGPSASHSRSGHYATSIVAVILVSLFIIGIWLPWPYTSTVAARVFSRGDESGPQTERTADQAAGRPAQKVTPKAAKTQSTPDTTNSSRADVEVQKQALFALSQSPQGIQKLMEVAQSLQNRELRKQAIFWLSQRGGDEAGSTLNQIFREDSDPEIRKQILFAYTQMSREAGIPRLIEAAKTERDREVRKQAIFWLSQRGGDEALSTLDQIFRDNPDREMRKHILFTYIQVPHHEGIPRLIEVAKNADEDADVRKQAIFWLGQSDDPRARDVLIDIIQR
ncbi:MAG: HEAT repeat domain-containing protein [Candidatus Latescibacteria bacterium]|nr:HEAT repeat domain-containing protein [Candidatus Latescibacterota bacterium]